MQSIRQNPRLDEAQAGIQIARRNSNNLKYANDNTLMAESKEDTKEPLVEVKEENQQADLKLNIQKTKIMSPAPITSWQIDGERMETVREFYFLGLQNHCSHEIKSCLLLGRKAMTNLDSLLKSRDIILPYIGPAIYRSIYQSYGFPSSHVLMCELDHKQG